MTDAAATRNPRATRGPVQRSERALAPDLARGAMLLLIALANSAGVFFVSAPGIEPEPHGLERGYNLFMFTFVHARALPMFAFMFGYGLVLLALRQEAAGATPGAVRTVLLRRNAWLAAFGLVHGILLLSGDILGAYGIVGIVFTLLLLRRGDRFHRLVLWIWGATTAYMVGLAAVAVWGIANGTGERATIPTREFDVGWASMEAPTYAASVVARLGEWPAHTLYASGVIFVVWLGAWAARRRILEEPARHRRLLWCTATGGLGIAVAGGLPMGLFSAGVLEVDVSTAGWIKLLYEVSGSFGGVGYVALFGLLALALSRMRSAPASNPVIGALVALGQRSLSGYLFQSFAWLALVSPWALNLGARADSPTFTAAWCAVGVWLATVAGAALMQRYALQGPAEVLLRRLTYGRRRATTAPAARRQPSGR
ncbi:putative membrane protein YeiB [Lipingzhangella halophila]|uniref:Putative membrane protein YeiB n=1 Tax=Lipingzhangella halophila TaxID=1783352 RepID=A0A7W7RMZ5_9ACTN|nr:DUF418 domain-containing protein [Lipingzhangella halophila]MBB4934983.1 putative membrane protein YeiB [Lipingzhangella halophila]